MAASCQHCGAGFGYRRSIWLVYLHIGSRGYIGTFAERDPDQSDGPAKTPIRVINKTTLKCQAATWPASIIRQFNSSTVNATMPAINPRLAPVIRGDSTTPRRRTNHSSATAGTAIII